MKKYDLLAGASQKAVTPPIGLAMAGWAKRAAGDNLAHYIHDDIHVKALYVQGRNCAWVLISAEVGSVDPVTTAKIRQRVSSEINLSPAAILVCATHCHSAPILSPVALACTTEEFKNNSVDGKNGSAKSSWDLDAPVKPGVAYTGAINSEWKEMFINKAASAAIEAWEMRQPVEASYGEAEIEGVASSRRVILRDGSLADPRKCHPDPDDIVFKSEIDPLVRNLFLRKTGGDELLAVLVNYGTHPWLFSVSGISAELAGAVSDKVSAGFKGNPITIYTTGPEGDVSNIWNLDVDNLWKVHHNENEAESLKRRELVYDRELDRLGKIIFEGIGRAYQSVDCWNGRNEIAFFRKEIKLPLKRGYSHLPEIPLAEWQKSAPAGYHLTEIQLFQLGDIAILGLPGEPFSSVGKLIRENLPFEKLIITALSNDCGTLTYIPDEKAYRQGGYEPTITTLSENAGQILVDEIVKNLR